MELRDPLARVRDIWLLRRLLSSVWHWSSSVRRDLVLRLRVPLHGGSVWILSLGGILSLGILSGRVLSLRILLVALLRLSVLLHLRRRDSVRALRCVELRPSLGRVWRGGGPNG
jgi:hypothetical protein